MKDFIFGLQPVAEALKAGQDVEKLLILPEMTSNPKWAEISQLARQRYIPVQKVPYPRLQKITRKNHQGVIAFISAVPFIPLNQIVQEVFEQGENPLIVVLDRITDVRNFGAISRSAECVGAHAIVVPTRGAAQVNSDAMKTSAGALNHISVCREANLSAAVEYLQNSGLYVVACTEKAEDSIYQINWRQPTALLMGSEEDGISENLLKAADSQARIPLQGQISSLNVSVATGVILFEALRQRMGG